MRTMFAQDDQKRDEAGRFASEASGGNPLKGEHAKTPEEHKQAKLFHDKMQGYHAKKGHSEEAINHKNASEAHQEAVTGKHSNFRKAAQEVSRYANHVSGYRASRQTKDSALVGDSLRGEVSMKRLTPVGALLQGALICYTLPRLAADAKMPDFKGILSGAPTTNRVSQRAGIAQALQTVVKPHLAADADLDDVAELLEAIEKVAGGEGEVGEDLEANSAIPMMQDPDDGEDEHPAAAKIKEICERHNLPPEVCNELTEAVGMEEGEEGGLDFYDRRAADARTRMGRDETEAERERREDDEGAADARTRMGRDETEAERDERRGEDAARHGMRRARDAMRKMNKDAKAEDRKRAEDAIRTARDAHRRAADARRKGAMDRKRAEDARKASDMVTKKDAEDMVKRAVDARRAEDRALYEAREFVRPWVGDVRMACDSAEQVHREALKMLGEADAAKIHESALRAVIERTPKPNERRPTYALDTKLPDGVKPASERFTNVGRSAVLS